jgi:uncharacterized membrane protein
MNYWVSKDGMSSLFCFFLYADLLNLGKFTGLGAPVASIGGAGTFDGILLTGILAVLIAATMTGKRSSPS